jgi:Fe-Mn family superoxide dismutase
MFFPTTEASMAYTAKNYESLLGTKGFSDTLLKNHFTLYQGYVANTNKVADMLVSLHREGKTAVPEYAEISRRFGWEFNGMRLHEYYFDNMVKGGKSPDKGDALLKRMEKDFGGFEHWESDFRGKGALRGIGWTILYLDRLDGGRLYNVWVNEHDAGHLSGAQPLLVMDVFEHAFMTDYGLKRAEYIDAFLKAVDWGKVAGRFDAPSK